MGMNLRSGIVQSNSNNFSHACGNGPGGTTKKRWKPIFPINVMNVGVALTLRMPLISNAMYFPMFMGINLIRAVSLLKLYNFLHIYGDESVRDEANSMLSEFSSRIMGMNLLLYMSYMMKQDFPHTCGDEPSYHRTLRTCKRFFPCIMGMNRRMQQGLLNVTFSPYMWG